MYSKFSSSWAKHWDFILLDMLCIEFSFWLAYMFRHGFIIPFSEELYRQEATVLLVSQLLAVLLGNVFSGVLRRGFYIEFARTVKHVLLTMVLGLVIFFVYKETGSYSRLVFGITGVIYAIVGYGTRIAWKHFLKNRAVGTNAHSMIVVTTKEMVQEVIENLEEEAFQQYTIKGICLMGEEVVTVQADYEVVGNENDLIGYVQCEWVDDVFFALPKDMEVPQELMDVLAVMGVATHVTIFAKKMKGSKQFVRNMGGYTVLTTSMSIVETKQMAYKRILDIAGGIVGCLITLLLIVIVGPIIYIKSPGPIFFTQTRIGKNGRKFKIYKFRSMYMDAEERKKELMEQNKMSGHMFKLDYDPRIIGSERIGKDGKPKGIGNFIRSTSIDEFPQFWNVLKGDMSLVGTRPPTLDEWEQYEPHHRARMAIKPGITGMWQVSGRSDITDFEEVVKLDTEYIETWNFGLDIKILLMTVLKVLKNDGAV